MAIKDIFENYYRKLNKDIDMQSYKKYMENKISNISISSTDRLYLAREKNRPTSIDFLDNILEDKLIFKGDRIGGEDSSIISGIGRIKDLNISFVAIEKGKTFQEKVENNFGMVSPEGFRKAIRIFKEAEKFNRPVLTIIDTPGANPSPKSEENGQSQQIANSLLTMSSLKVPIISIIISEGYSGGALSLSLCDYLIMLENAIFSILSPEGFGSIIFRDSSKVEEAAKLLKFTAKDMKDFDICQEIIPEKIDPSYEYYKEIFSYLQKDVYEKFKDLQKFSSVELIEKKTREVYELGLIIEKASKIDLEDKRDNFYFEKRLDTTDEWIRKRTGIKERFISHTPLSEMATDVAFKLNLSQEEKERIKILIVSTIGGDYIVPSLASYVHGKLSLPQEVLAFDINMACSGFVGASILCETYLKENELALVIGAEKLSDFTDMADRSTAIIFADGAGAVLYKKDSSKFYKDLGTIFDSKNLTLKRNSYLKMNGREVFKFAINEVPKSIKKLLQESGLKDEDIDIFLLHQANERIKNSVEKHFKGYFYSNIETMGNTSSASVAMSLGDLYEKNILKDKKILLCGFGGGLNYQTCIVRG